MNFHISISRTSIFQIFGLLCGIFHFYSIFIRNFCKQTVENLIRRRVFAASDLVLHCLLMSQKKDTMLIWVKDHCLHIEDQSVYYGASLICTGQCTFYCAMRITQNCVYMKSSKLKIDIIAKHN